MLLVLPCADLGALRIPPLDSLLRLFECNSPILAKAVSGLSVRYGKVKDLSPATLRAEHVLEERDGRWGLVITAVVPLEQTVSLIDSPLDMVVHAERGPRVKVASKLKRLDHGATICHVCQDTELELSIIRHDQRVSLLAIRCERLTNPVTILFQGGLILQVGTSRGQPACLRVDVQRTMDSLNRAPGAEIGFQDSIRLQRHDEVGQQGVDGRGIDQRVHRRTGSEPLFAVPEQRKQPTEPLFLRYLLKYLLRLFFLG
mmetsp:Transcript_14740/g.42073  ORF Transcript_14740/g.42073 Transcript_14740/m.42073 type:complete len:258 (-) Transcript_14740:4351-5124(-)